MPMSGTVGAAELMAPTIVNYVLVQTSRIANVTWDCIGPTSRNAYRRAELEIPQGVQHWQHHLSWSSALSATNNQSSAVLK